MTVPGYVISSVRTGPSGFVYYGIVTDRLERVNVAVPRRHTSDELVRQIIDHALEGAYSPGKPLGIPLG